MAMKRFSVSLLAYHLYQHFDDDPDSYSSDAAQIWESAIALHSSLPFPELKDLKDRLVCYEDGEFTGADNGVNEWLTHKQEAINLTTIDLDNSLALKGILQPFILHDTYAYDLYLEPVLSPEWTLDRWIKIISVLQERTASLGKTIWIDVQLEDNNKQADVIEAIKLLPGFTFTDAKHPELLDCDFFEWEAIASNSSVHIICTFQRGETTNYIETIGKNYNWLRDLFWYRHKILYVDRLAKQAYRSGRKLYNELEDKIPQFEAAMKRDREAKLALEAAIKCDLQTKLELEAAVKRDRETKLAELENLLSDLPQQFLDYNCTIRDLEAHYTTMSVNHSNYKLAFDRLSKSDFYLSHWHDFQTYTESRRLPQIKTYLKYLQPGTDLFEQLKTTVLGTLEIERQTLLRELDKNEADRDRALQNTIAIVGVGLGSAAVGATISPYLVEEQPNRDFAFPFRLDPFAWNPIHPLTVAVLCSLGFGILGLAIGWIFTKLIHTKT